MRFAYKLSFCEFERRIRLNIPNGFTEKAQVKSRDFLLPTLVRPEHKLKKEDPIFGARELIFHFRRRTSENLLEAFDELEDEDFGCD